MPENGATERLESESSSVSRATTPACYANLILAPFAHMPKTSATLLIIDDDEVVRASLAAYLEDSGFSVLQASNGQQGLQVFEQDKPDLVICDLRMPQMGGLELIRQVTERSPQTPVIVVSGAGVMNDAVEALRLGAADYLIKPLEDLAVLEHSVRRALDRARLLLENQRYREKLEKANRELEASLNLLQEDQNAGRQVQMNMLPVSPWTIDEFQFAHQIIPSLYLSGDFVDYFRVDERRVAFYLADVSGHGASSAFVTVLLKFMTTRLLFESKRSGTLPEFKPSEVLGHINRGLISCKLGKHVTMVGGVIDEETGLLTYSIGGHLPLPVLYTPDSVQLSGRARSAGRPLQRSHLRRPRAGAASDIQPDADVRWHPGPFARTDTQRKRSGFAPTGQGSGRQPGWSAAGFWIGHAGGDAG